MLHRIRNRAGVSIELVNVEDPRARLCPLGNRLLRVAGGRDQVRLFVMLHSLLRATVGLIECLWLPELHGDLVLALNRFFMCVYELRVLAYVDICAQLVRDKMISTPCEVTSAGLLAAVNCAFRGRCLDNLKSQGHILTIKFLSV